MAWPWVSRSFADQLSQKLVETGADLEKALKDLKAARDAGTDCAMRLSACDHERLEIKANFAKLAALSRSLEVKLRDCEDPPITRKELEKLTKLIAVLRSENEGLKRHVERSDATIERMQSRADDAS